MDLNTVLDSLVASLKPSDPYKIILFGSHAKENPNKDSVIDLMVYWIMTMFQKHTKKG